MNARSNRNRDKNRIVISLSPATLLSSVAVIVFVILLNISVTWYNVQTLRSFRPPPPKEYSYVGDDFPAQLPLDLPHVSHEIGDASELSLLADDAWGALFPPKGNGFINVGPTNRTFVLAMYHQLHCLDVIRVNYILNGTGAAGHIEHCLQYLKQTVLCSADTTLEITVQKRRKNGQLSKGGVSEGSVHRCRDWKAVEKWIDSTQPDSIM